jgi:hypothetical protein
MGGNPKGKLIILGLVIGESIISKTLVFTAPLRRTFFIFLGPVNLCLVSNEHCVVCRQRSYSGQGRSVLRIIFLWNLKPSMYPNFACTCH